jgi:hypothetical protein
MVNKKGVNMDGQNIENKLNRIESDVSEIRKTLEHIYSTLQDIEFNTEK